MRFAALVAIMFLIFWGIWYIAVGSVPQAHIPLGDDGTALFSYSHWWDVLLAPMILLTYWWIIVAIGSIIKPGERRTAFYMEAGIITGVLLGTVVALCAAVVFAIGWIPSGGTPTSITATGAGAWLPAMAVAIAVGLMGSAFICTDDLRAGLTFVVTYGLFANLALTAFTEGSIALAMALGLMLTMLTICLVVIIVLRGIRRVLQTARRRNLARRFWNYLTAVEGK
jgi:hypothetical protein